MKNKERLEHFSLVENLQMEVFGYFFGAGHCCDGFGFTCVALLYVRVTIHPAHVHLLVSGGYCLHIRKP